MTPDTLAKANTEHAHQRAVFAWLNVAGRHGFAAAYDDRSYTVLDHATGYGNMGACGPLLWAYAIPNGGKRDKITAGKLKAEGVKPGVPDIHVPFAIQPYHGLYVEMKRPKTEGQAKGHVSKATQTPYHEYLRNAGYAVAVAYNWRDAVGKIEAYMLGQFNHDD